MGFERIDRIAREMKAGGGSPDGPRRRSPRSTSWRLGTLVLLGVAGVTGALYFVVGGSAKPEVPVAKRMLNPGPSPSPSPSPNPNPSPNPSPDPNPSPSPSPRLALAGGGEQGVRAAQIAVVLDDVDATLHGVRLAWPGRGVGRAWPWPTWMTAERMDSDLGALAAQLEGASDPLSIATQRWLEVSRPAGARLHALVLAWAEPGASADGLAAELVPLFDQMVASSAAVRAAVAAQLPAPEPGSLAALATACRTADLLARLPPRGAAAGVGVAERDGDRAVPAPMPDVAADELHARSTACLDEIRAFVAARPVMDHNDVYHLRMVSSAAIGLLEEVQRRSRPGAATYITAAGNLAQQSSYVAISRRKLDPSLRQPSVELEAPPP